MSFAPDTAPEFQDPERSTLIAELYANTSLGDGVMEGTPETQAFLWLGDAGCLRALVEESRGAPRPAIFLLGGALQSARVADTWLAKTKESKSKRGQKRKAKDMAAGDGDDARDQRVKNRIKARDQERCTVIEAEGPLDIAHIYPFCLNGRTHLDSQVKFWNVLGSFWPVAKIEAWKSAILGEEGTEHPRNMLSLAPHVHKYWGQALFALKPLEQSDDGKSLTAEFHWLKQRTGEKSVTVTEMPTLATAIDSPGCCIKLWNNRTEQKIVTGHRVIFRTDDPIEHPLPSWELLEMQWHLQRVAAMAGAGEQDDEDADDDDDDDDLSVSDQAGVGELSDAGSSDHDCDWGEDDNSDESDSDDDDEGGDDHASALHGTDVILPGPQTPIVPSQPQISPPSFPSARRQSLSPSARRAYLSPSASHPNHPLSTQLMDWTSNLPSRPAPFGPSAHLPATQPDPLAAPQENVPPTPRQTRRRDSDKQESPTREDSQLRRPLR